jgi:hypothetical protein
MRSFLPNLVHGKVRSNRAQFKAFLLSVRELSVPVGTAQRIFSAERVPGLRVTIGRYVHESMRFQAVWTG